MVSLVEIDVHSPYLVVVIIFKVLNDYRIYHSFVDKYFNVSCDFDNRVVHYFVVVIIFVILNFHHNYVNSVDGYFKGSYDFDNFFVCPKVVVIIFRV